MTKKLFQNLLILLTITLITNITTAQTAFGYRKSGNEKYSAGNYQEAIQDYTKAIELLKDTTGIRSVDRDLDRIWRTRSLGISYCERGNAKANLEDYQGAIQDYNKAIISQLEDYSYLEGYSHIFYNRGLAKQNLSDNRGAILDFNKAIDLTPKFAEVYYACGLAKAKLENWNEALLEFDKAIELSPKYAEAYYKRGLIKAKLENWNGACLDWSKAGELGYSKAYDAIKKMCNQP